MWWVLLPCALLDLRLFLVVGLVVLFVGGRDAWSALRAAWHRRPLQRFAAREGHRFDAAPRVIDLPTDYALLAGGGARNVVQGERRGRRFAAFDVTHAADVPSDGRMCIDLRRFESAVHLSAVIVGAAIAPGASRSALRRRLAPWCVGISPGSVIAWRPRLASPAELVRVIDALNAELDAQERR